MHVTCESFLPRHYSYEVKSVSHVHSTNTLWKAAISQSTILTCLTLHGLKWEIKRVTVWRCFQTLVTLQVKHLLQSSSASENRRCSMTHATGSNSRFLWLPWPPGDVFVARPSRAHPFSPEHPITCMQSSYLIHSTCTSLGCNLSYVIICIANVFEIRGPLHVCVQHIYVWYIYSYIYMDLEWERQSTCNTFYCWFPVKTPCALVQKLRFTIVNCIQPPPDSLCACLFPLHWEHCNAKYVVQKYHNRNQIQW